MARHCKFARFSLVALGLASANVAVSQSPSDPSQYLGASQAFTWEDNLFRVPDSQRKTDDVISTTSLLAGISRPFGRQRLFADASARHNRYQDSSQLNHTGFGVDVGLDWATIERLSGTLSYSANQALASFGVNEGPRITNKRNLERNQQVLARAQLGATSLLALEATVIHRQRDFSAAEFAFAEFDQDSAGLGLLYRPSGLLTLGTAVRHTRGEYPFAVQPAPGVFRADKFDRNDVDLTAVWVPTGLSTVRARLSYSKEEHDQVRSRDFSGPTGALTWEYKPTGKLTFTTDLIRETGTESSFAGFTGANLNPVNNNSQRSSSLQIRGQYEFSAKIQFDATARYTERDLVTTSVLATGGSSTTAGSDKTGLLTIGARYEPTRNWLVGCNYGFEKHGGSTSVSSAFEANIFGCLAQFTLR